jgi:hypothetical protein
MYIKYCHSGRIVHLSPNGYRDLAKAVVKACGPLVSDAASIGSSDECRCAESAPKKTNTVCRFRFKFFVALQSATKRNRIRFSYVSHVLARISHQFFRFFSLYKLFFVLRFALVFFL